MIDIRHAPGSNDCIMYDWICKQGYKPVIIATKLDKIKRSQVAAQVKLIKSTLKADADTVVIPFSAQSRQGKDEIYEFLDRILQA